MKKELHLDLIENDSLNAMVANMTEKYGFDSEEVDFFTRRVKEYPVYFTSEEILNSYFVMYNFGKEAFKNLR